MKGLVHIYCGDGKGKTTAAVGLTVRAAGTGKRVVFTQFFKDGTSGEVGILEKLPQVQTFHCRTHYGLFFRMTPEERERASQDYTALLEQALEAALHADLLILDEVISACNHGTVPLGRVTEFLRRKPEGLEVVLTGREPGPELLEYADYITEMKKLRHPFDQGIGARKGIEF